MSNNNRIFDDKYRENFMRAADPISLNSYLKNMNKLAKRKGGKFMEIYNKDLTFLVGLNDTMYQDGGDLSTLFSQLPKKQIAPRYDNQMTEVCDTEAYIGRINNITKNSYCTLTTQDTGICDNTCETRFQELETIKKVLNPDCRSMNLNHIKAIRKFIDIVICCGDVFTKTEYEPLRTIYFKDLSKVVTKNDGYLREAFSYLTKILQNEKNKLSEEFMRDYSTLRKAKSSTPRAQHKANKEKLIGNYITKLGPEGFQKVYSSKLVEKVINSYKKMMAPKNRY
jgi:hypothetical protein